MHELALFAGGGGGGLLGSILLGWRTVGYVEANAYRAAIIIARIQDGYLHDAPIWDDVRSFDGGPWRGKVDIVTAGFPCQPWSCAGKRLGERDRRNLWPDTHRIITEVRPEWVALENVPRLYTHKYFGSILDDLESAGYYAPGPPRLMAAGEIGANHKRLRLWVVAHNNREYAHGTGFNPSKVFRIRRAGAALSDADRQGCGQSSAEIAAATSGRIMPPGNRWWAAESGMVRVVNGVAYRVDRIEALGEGQVPGVVASVWGEIK